MKEKNDSKEKNIRKAKELAKELIPILDKQARLRLGIKGDEEVYD